MNNDSPPYRIGRSRTGLGMFATAEIKKGKFIAEYTGEVIDNKEADRRARSRYLFDVNSRWTVDGKTRTNVARYINHACRPNSEPYITGKVIKIRSLRKIRPEEEITYNYGKEYFDAFIKQHGCRCAACQKKKAAKRKAASASGTRVAAASKAGLKKRSKAKPAPQKRTGKRAK